MDFHKLINEVINNQLGGQIKSLSSSALSGVEFGNKMAENKILVSSKTLICYPLIVFARPLRYTIQT